MDRTEQREHQYLALPTAASVVHIRLVGAPPDPLASNDMRKTLEDVAHSLATFAPIYAMDDFGVPVQISLAEPERLCPRVADLGFDREHIALLLAPEIPSLLVTSNVHNDRRTPPLRASVSIVLLDRTSQADEARVNMELRHACARRDKDRLGALGTY